jgi:hypothetical protein
MDHDKCEFWAQVSTTKQLEMIIDGGWDLDPNTLEYYINNIKCKPNYFNFEKDEKTKVMTLRRMMKLNDIENLFENGVCNFTIKTRWDNIVRFSNTIHENFWRITKDRNHIMLKNNDDYNIDNRVMIKKEVNPQITVMLKFFRVKNISEEKTWICSSNKSVNIPKNGYLVVFNDQFKGDESLIITYYRNDKVDVGKINMESKFEITDYPTITYKLKFGEFEGEIITG